MNNPLEKGVPHIRLFSSSGMAQATVTAVHDDGARIFDAKLAGHAGVLRGQHANRQHKTCEYGEYGDLFIAIDLPTGQRLLS